MLRDICSEEIPAWHELSWSPEQGLLVKVHRVYARDLLPRWTGEIPIVKALASDKILQLDPYVAPPASNWGFGGVLQQLPDEQPFTVWKADLPCVRNREDQFGFVWGPAYNISATLAILLGGLFFSHNDLTWQSPRQQLVTCRLGIHSDPSDHFLLVRLSKKLVVWLSGFPEDTTLPSVTQAMSGVYFKMLPDERSQIVAKLELRAYIAQPGWLHFNVPGNRCGLDPDFNASIDRGYELQPHNVDNPVQQLALLVGIAALCDLYRAENP